MKVTAITATCGRHTCLERIVSFFLQQDYQNKHLLIYQNSEIPQILDSSIDTANITLINNHIDSKTGKRYETLGAIYNDALKYIPSDTEVVVHMDDDEIVLPYYLSEGVEGYKRAIEINKSAYKPKKSYFRNNNGIALIENTLEPSIFVSLSHLKEFGYSNLSTEQHLQWVDPLVYGAKILVDEAGKPGLCYNWGDNFPTFKTSGDCRNPSNFENYRTFSQDHGDQIITLIDQLQLDRYYNEIYTFLNGEKI